MTDYAKHIGSLNAARNGLHPDAMLLKALTAAIDLMQAAQPKDAKAEQKHCVRQLREHRHRDEAGRIQGLIDERAAARAEGYEAGKSDAGAEWVEGSVALEGVCRDLSASLADARAEIVRLRAAYDTQLRRPPSETELPRRLRDKLINLRTAAEQHLEQNPACSGVFRFRAAIEASK
jgi:flagellar biosynthesis/type III secretory pathway protein FliH